MAVSRFFCHICLKDFHFASTFDRHVRTPSHRRMEEMLTNQPEDCELQCNQQSSSVDEIGVSTEAAAAGSTSDLIDSDHDYNVS